VVECEYLPVLARYLHTQMDCIYDMGNGMMVAC